MKTRLTVDDGLCRNGASASMVSSVAALLEEYNAHATFFVCSDYLVGVEADAAALVAAGHELGNHMTSDIPFHFHRLRADKFAAELRRVQRQ